MPVMSLGIRSGVNWMRLKSRFIVRASVRTISVFASPGTPTTSVCARQNMAMRSCSSTSSCPTITRRTSLSSFPRTSPSRAMSFSSSSTSGSARAGASARR